MTTSLPRAAMRPRSINKWIRTTFLAPYLRSIPSHQMTLDLACGWGFSFGINPNFYGVELDDECVRFCQERGFKVKKANLLEQLPFPIDFFDTCFTHDVLEHFEPEDLDLIFINVRRVLRPGGIFMNIIPNRKGYDYGLREDIGHRHFATPGEIEKVARRTGFFYERAYSSPVPEIMNSWFTHAKYVTLCRKPGSRL